MTNLLFIHGGGDGALQASQELLGCLRHELPEHYPDHGTGDARNAVVCQLA